MRSAVALIIIIGAAACARKIVPIEPAPAVAITTAPPAIDPPMPTLQDVWQFTLLTVAPLAQRGDYAAADSALATFASSHPGSCEASESAFIQALLRLSPNNTSAKPESALPLLDQYLGSRCVAPGRAAEVLLVRKLATDLSRHSAATDSASAEETRKLKEQLDQTKKELDRLKMRVIPP